MKKRLQSGLGALLALTMSGQAFALGTASYSSELISTRSLGQGGTGVAGVHDDPIVAYTNPAGMTGLEGTQVTVDMTYANASPKYTSGATSAGGLGANFTQANQGDVTGARATSVIVPSFGATTRFLDGKLAAGLAVVTPYGLETHWDGDSPLRYTATDARLRIIDVTPSVAYKVNDVLSVGAGFDYYNAPVASLEQKANVQSVNFVMSGGADFIPRPDANVHLSGTGDGWGYHLGTTIRPNEHHQIGIAYHSNVKVNLTGQQQIIGLSGTSAAVFGRDFTTNVTAPVYIPQNVQIGYAWMPDSKWQVEADAAWYDWYAARQLGIVYSGLTSAQSSVLNAPGTNPQLFKPRKTLNFGFGVNHRCTETLQTRAGFYYQAAALPEGFFDPAFIDLPRYALTFGAGWKATESFGVDFAYNAVFFHGRAIDANSAGGGTGYHGNFNNFANIVSASLTYRTAAHF